MRFARLFLGVFGTPIDFREVKSFPAFECRGFIGDFDGKLLVMSISMRGLLSDGLKILYLLLNFHDQGRSS